MNDALPHLCANCGKLRYLDSNRWFLLIQAGKFIETAPWDDETARKDGVVKACGQACCSILHSQWLANGVIEQRKPQPPTMLENL